MQRYLESNTRRQLVARSGELALIAAAVVIAWVPRPAAAAKATKSDFFYQDKPKEGKSCGTCRLFVPGDSATGRCAVVDGDVSRSGWCMAYSARA